MNEEAELDSARREAAVWRARLASRSVDRKTLDEFARWHKTPANRDAYAAIEAVWRAGDALAHDREVAEAVADTLKRSHARARHRERLVIAASLVLVTVTAGALYQHYRANIYRTAVGEEIVVHLDDGSTMQLNTQSQARVSFTSAERRVHLAHGEGFFDVAHDPARPFIVDADGAEVRAIGTAFDVRRDDDEVRVALVRGVVGVRRTDPTHPAEARMTAGQTLTLPEQGQAFVARNDVAVATSWTRRQIVFAATPLGVAIAEVNRYARHPIEVDGEMPAGASVSGTFATGDVDGFAKAVALLFGLDRRDEEDAIRLVPRPGAVTPSNT